MATKLRRRRQAMSEINVVPYIDVMLVLLVIFMTTAPLITQGVKVDLPQASTEVLPEEDEEPTVVTVDREGRFYLNVGDDPERPLSTDELATKVQATLRLKPATHILVRGDHRVHYGQVVQAMVIIQAAGASGVGLMTDPPETGT
ncbi:MAG: protein TolR [Pseudomonadota bacterium]